MALPSTAGLHTSALGAPAVGPVVVPLPLADVRTVLLLAGTALLALLAVYFIGIDEGAMSVFGHSAVVHEFFHDGRHFLGFPCH